MVHPDGAFRISEEYSPLIAQYDRDGDELHWQSPCNGGLPDVSRLRRRNCEMEGITITPDGEWLVGIMQAPLESPSSAGTRNGSRATRILFRHTATGATREYLYLLDSPALQGDSELVALSATRFLVLERDTTHLVRSTAATVKKIYEIDITNATDVSSAGALGVTPIGGTRPIEQATVAELTAAGIVPVSKTLAADLVELGYPHDKPEGPAPADGMLLVVDDDDFAINSADGELIPKVLISTGEPDFVTLWQIRLPGER